METAVSLRSGAQSAPDFATLAVPLARTLKRVSDHLATRPMPQPRQLLARPLQAGPKPPPMR